MSTKTRNIALTDQQDELVEELVHSGRYQSASEVVREALRLLEDKIETRQAELDEIRSGVLEGLAQAQRGDFAEGTGREAIERAFEESLRDEGV